MKYILQIVFLAIILTSCKEEKKNTEKTIERGIVILDTVKKEKTDKIKVIPNYSSIEKPIIREKDYLEFFNEILNTKGLIIGENIKILEKDSTYWKSELIYLTEKSRDSSLSEILDLNDVRFMLEQENTQKDFSLKPNRIKRNKISLKKLNEIESKNENLQDYWNEIYKYGEGFYSLSLPVFSIDKSIAIFDYSYSCGSLCAESSTHVYKKKNGKWVYIGFIGIMTVS